ncbi:sel1 repeat family protein [Pseudomonas alliivorans]|nr:sel1 repeat family protein [Pseudomonas alliivorans]MEE4745298.1 sel1 repeat family protein [Pseudomonas alliivorans]MEE5046934.1 sel1 repeat family protein [Pseudomonas alliivorans]MEE5072794.1 sel1 repeat family protein [Pseudomonas alliivorans]MEE5128803.1 sel1 repeat family protein [Pseudomonas alliivorans]
MRLTLLFSGLLLVTCSTANANSLRTRDTHLDNLNDINYNLAFTCVHEKIPSAPGDTDVLFKYARWLQKNNELKQDKTVDAEIERLYRIAAENQHYKANVNLQNGTARGQFKLRGAEVLRLSQQLIEANVAAGYYLIGTYLQRGVAGLQQDSEMALRYYRKGADMGNPQAQTYVAEKLEPIGIAPNVARNMRWCAAEQGSGEAATALGNDLSIDKHYQESLEAFQLGVAAGDETAAFFLENAFQGPNANNNLYFLNQKEDLKRVDRYREIGKLLGGWSYANPTVPEINDIVPLPPAKLPAWDGKLKWIEERKANVQPPKPTEALIEQLAKARLLDPKTGKPLPESPLYEKD